MDTIRKFINENKTIIIIVLLVILLLIIWFRILPHLSAKEGFSDSESTIMMNGLVGKNVYITCDVAGLKHYLAILPTKNCYGAGSGLNECQFNIPILQNTKTEHAAFEIGKHPSENKYTIRSLNTQLNSPNLTQNLNFYNGGNKLCFDNDKDPEIIYFETEKVESGVLLKFKKAGKDYYVGVCAEADARCNEDIRLCVFPEAHLAIPFRFEMTTPKPIALPVQKVESFDDVPSVYSSASFQSNGTLMSSLPGADCVNCRIYQNL